ncbi:MAG: SPOR domain-containing protein [candidate division Zixibacteria bacterium]|nr:SPOR domain-containing protein [candidate division Zixibacteria bacterium]
MKSEVINGIVIISSIILAVFLQSCAGIQPYYDDNTSKDTRTKAEKDYDPLGFEGDGEVLVSIDGDASGGSYSGIDDYQLIGKPLDSLNARGSFVYRVQVFTSRFLQEAENARDELFGQFEETIYLDFEKPYYKVRMGDFLTPEEGEGFLSEVRDLGYTEVWLVKVKQQDSLKE